MSTDGHGQGQKTSARRYLRNAWHNMISRCHNQSNRQYYMYGARGVSVCAEWLVSFEAFRDHVGERPAPGYSLDRIDNARGYEPGNVRWATAAEQARNTRRTRIVEISGERMCVKDWSRNAGIKEGLILHRLKQGITGESLLAPPSGLSEPTREFWTKILLCVRDHDAPGIDDVAKILGRHYDVVKNALTAMRKRGLVVRGGTRCRSAFRLTPAGLDMASGRLAVESEAA